MHEVIKERVNKMKKQKDRLYKFCRIIYSFIIKILYRPKFYGIENIPDTGSLIFAGNHKCALDPIIVMSSTNRVIHYMAKSELFKGLHGKLFEKIGLIKINRGKNNIVAIKQTEEILENGGTVGIFPEGTRNRTKNELLNFKYGTVIIAKKTNTPIIPFAIRGKYKLFRKSLEIEFGKPFKVNNIEIDEANKYLKQEVLNILRK